MSVKIEGIPDGWYQVRVGSVQRGEVWVDDEGKPSRWDSDESTSVNFVIIREKPKRYRPFANAAEFEPHRDRWVRRSHTGADIAGCFRVLAYNETDIWDSGSNQTYHQMFYDGRQFADGTPFGVEVVE